MSYFVATADYEPVAGPFDDEDEARDYRTYVQDYSDLTGLIIVGVDV